MRDWDDDGYCDNCGAKAVWPPTGEPAVAVCSANCQSKTESQGEAAAAGDALLFNEEAAEFVYQNCVMDISRTGIDIIITMYLRYLEKQSVIKSRQPSPAQGGVGDVERVAEAMIKRHKEMFGEDSILQAPGSLAHAAIAAMHTTDAPLSEKDKL